MREWPDWRDNYIPEPNSGCWIWLGAISAWGYGVVYPYGRVGGQHRAHRLMYEMHHGPIPEGLDACHRCDNRACCNPDHIFLGTDFDNMQDMVRKGRQGDQRGEKGNNARLTWADVAAIRAARGISVRQLANKYGIHPNHVYKIRSGENW